MIHALSRDLDDAPAVSLGAQGALAYANRTPIPFDRALANLRLPLVATRASPPVLLCGARYDSRGLCGAVLGAMPLGHKVRSYKCQRVRDSATATIDPTAD